MTMGLESAERGLMKKATKTAMVPVGEGQEILPFATQMAFRKWLRKNHASHAGVWIKFAKKNSGVPSVTYKEALDEALCYGWIDGPLRKVEEPFWVHLFKRRNPRSIWSQVNRGNVARLIEEGRMQAAGQAEIDAAQRDGRWDAAYASPSTAKIPADFLAALELVPEAKACFDSLNKTSRYSIYFALTTAKKPETRQRRFEQWLDKLKRGEKP
jgi:uncharacterized protein YdeI (YjbR/CyaY-like superfamily)